MMLLNMLKCKKKMSEVKNTVDVCSVCYLIYMYIHLQYFTGHISGIYLFRLLSLAIITCHMYIVLQVTHIQ